uniref:Uncharacterized protein n=1 Tax=Anguilla anguilla TaxID=7936 RepID=A0A0E9XBV8_ANGAN
MTFSFSKSLSSSPRNTSKSSVDSWTGLRTLTEHPSSMRSWSEFTARKAPSSNSNTTTAWVLCVTFVSLRE